GVGSGALQVIVGPPERPADLAVAMSAPFAVRAGDTLTTVVTVTNNGPGLATNVLLINVLPVDLELRSPTVTPSQGSCDTLGSFCRRGTLSIGDSAIVPVAGTAATAEFPLNMPPTAVRLVTTQFDPNPANNAAIAVTTVIDTAVPAADVAVTMSAAPG